jgi:hypothetical protein
LGNDFKRGNRKGGIFDRNRKRNNDRRKKIMIEETWKIKGQKIHKEESESDIFSAPKYRPLIRHILFI